jgi:hypothetical protein
MAWRLSQSILKGELDNRERGWVFGRLWLIGCEKPIELNLQGNCLPDLAGARIVFKNPNACVGDDVSLTTKQEGQVGDVTASRKVKLLACSLDEAHKTREAGERTPTRIANTLYLEWFSDSDGRIVVESVDFNFEIDAEPTWQMSEDEAFEQAEKNRLAIRRFVESNECGGDTTEVDGQEPPLDEFEWELRMRESDELTDRYSELLDTYAEHPDCERIVAREMGWHWVDDAIDADERGAFDTEADLNTADLVPQEPNPQSEGHDWIRTRDGRVKHPIANRAHVLSTRISRYFRAQPFRNDAQSDVFEWITSESRVLSTKLAGALDGLAYISTPDHGFIVAYLKRGLKHLESILGAFTEVQKNKHIDPARTRRFRAELFKIREEMITLMNVSRDALDE